MTATAPSPLRAFFWTAVLTAILLLAPSPGFGARAPEPPIAEVTVAVDGVANAPAVLALGVLESPATPQEATQEMVQCLIDALRDYQECLDASPSFLEFLCDIAFYLKVAACGLEWIGNSIKELIEMINELIES